MDGWPSPGIVTQHAKDQARDRYGANPTAAEWIAALCSIADAAAGTRSDATLLRKRADGSERWVVRVGHVVMIVIYIPAHARIVTVLPRNARMKQTRLARADGRARQVREKEEIWD